MSSNKQKHLVRFVLLLLLSGSLFACGFRLRGAVEVPLELKETSIAGIAEYSPLTREFKRVLTRAGSTVVKSGSGAQSTLMIQGGEFKKRVLSVDALGRVAEYELNYSYTFKIITSQGVELVPQQKIDLTRDYRFDPNNVLAKDTEESEIRTEMIRFSVSQAMRRINAILKSKS